MLFTEILILVAMLIVFVQDLRSRSVYWLLFPTLVVLFIGIDIIRGRPFSEIWPPVTVNLVFVILQLLVITTWFSLKEKRWVNVPAQLLGWGDILFQISIACYLSFVNFLVFHIVSLMIALIIWLIWQLLDKKKSKYIPLAGLQAMCFGLFMSADWYIFHFDTTNDAWLIHIFIKWI